MGFFKKIFKGIKKVFKKIGKGIKSAFKSIGKFMGKIGIIGQIGLALILPGVGQVLSGLLVGTTPGVVGGLAGTLQGMGAVGQAASSFIQGAVKVASNTSQFFSSVTDGVTKVVGDTIGAAAKSLGITTDSFIGQGLNKIGINVDESGWGKIFTNAQESLKGITEAGKSIFDISQPVGDPTATALAQDQMGNISQVSEGLQGQIDSATAFDVTSPIGETVVRAPNLSPDPFGPVGEIGGLTYEMGPPPSSLLGSRQMMQAPVSGSAGNIAETLAENIAQQGGAGTVADPFFASGKAAVAPEKSLLDKTSEFITGKSVDENLAYGRAKIREAVTDFVPETGKALGREAIAQATGLSPTAEQLRPIAYSSSVALGDFETSIGFNDYATSPYQSVIDQVGPQYATSHPYGLMAQQFNFNQYQEQARARGVPA